MNVPESQHLFAALWILSGAGLSLALKKLTLFGSFTGLCVASIVYFSGGYIALGVLSAFFITATAATSWKRKEKRSSISSVQYDRRDAYQVLANGGIAAVCGLIIFIFPTYTNLFLVMMAGSLASATADTLSSELGMVYGHRFYNVLSLKREMKGLDGVVSVEGTLAGLAGAIFIALIFEFGYPQTGSFWIICLAGFIGNLFDSILGVVLERKGILGNDMVNFLNTLAAALSSALMYYITI